MKKKQKYFNHNKKFGKNSTRRKSTSKPNETLENGIYIGNLPPGELKNIEINNLLNTFINSNPNYRNTNITSIKVLKDSLYIYFQNKNDAQNASIFFDGYNFKNYKLESFVINNNQSTQDDDEDEIDYEYNNIKQNQIECEILVANIQLKQYADTINDRVHKTLFGINTMIKYSNNDPNEEQLLTKDFLKDAFNRNLLYVITINQSNEQYNSLNLIIFNKWRLLKSEKLNHTIKENKNIPSNKAFDILKSDYRDYLDNIKEFYSNSNKDELKGLSETEKPKQYENVLDKNLFDHVLGRMIETDIIEIRELDFLATFISQQKSKLISELKPKTSASSSQSQIQQNNQSNIPSLMNQPIPSLLSQPAFFQPIQQPMNFIPTIGNFNQQIPSLMSLSNQPQSVQSTQAPSLMSLQTNYNYQNQTSNKNFNNYKRY